MEKQMNINKYEINDVERYRELAAFAQFASDLDEATRKQLERGRRVTELLKQQQYKPLQVWEMSASLFAANNGYLDDVEVKDVLSFEKGMIDFLKTSHGALVDRIESTKEVSKDDEVALNDAIKAYKQTAAF